LISVCYIQKGFIEIFLSVRFYARYTVNANNDPCSLGVQQPYEEDKTKVIIMRLNQAPCRRSSSDIPVSQQIKHL